MCHTCTKQKIGEVKHTTYNIELTQNAKEHRHDRKDFGYDMIVLIQERKVKTNSMTNRQTPLKERYNNKQNIKMSQRQIEIHNRYINKIVILGNINDKLTFNSASLTESIFFLFFSFDMTTLIFP